MTRREHFCTNCGNTFAVIVQDLADPAANVACEECGNPDTLDLYEEEEEED